jgi:hypothetical protein
VLVGLPRCHPDTGRKHERAQRRRLFPELIERVPGAHDLSVTERLLQLGPMRRDLCVGIEIRSLKSRAMLIVRLAPGCQYERHDGRDLGPELLRRGERGGFFCNKCFFSLLLDLSGR